MKPCLAKDDQQPGFRIGFRGSGSWSLSAELFFALEGLKKMNIERPTSNVEWKTKTRATILLDFRVTWGAKRHHYSAFNVQCSMLDVHLLISPVVMFQKKLALVESGFKVHRFRCQMPGLKCRVSGESWADYINSLFTGFRLSFTAFWFLSSPPILLLAIFMTGLILTKCYILLPMHFSASFF